MKQILLLLVSLSWITVLAQEEKKWTVGLGVNLIDNTNSKDGNYFNTSNWNYNESLSKLSVQYLIKPNFSASSEFTLNMLHKDNFQNGATVSSNAAYFGWDLNMRYNASKWIGLSPKIQIEPIAGVGLFWAGTISNQSINTGISIGYLFNDAYGIRLQTLGKFALDENKVGNNMIQHSLEFIFKL